MKKGYATPVHRYMIQPSVSGCRFVDCAVSNKMINMRSLQSSQTNQIVLVVDVISGGGGGVVRGYT